MFYRIALEVKYRPEAFGGIAQSSFGSLVIMDLSEYELFLSYKQPRTSESLSPEEKEFVVTCIDEGLLAAT